MYDKRITNIIAPRLQIRSLNTDKRKATLLKITNGEPITIETPAGKIVAL
jgi:hypothetical protein